jgi:hypothetical protein
MYIIVVSDAISRPSIGESFGTPCPVCPGKNGDLPRQNFRKISHGRSAISVATGIMDSGSKKGNVQVKESGTYPA